MTTMDFLTILFSIISIIISLIPYRIKVIEKLNEIYITDGYKKINNGISFFSSVIMVLSYLFIAMLYWRFYFLSSIVGLYICLGFIVPIVMFAVYFYKATYMERSVM